MPSVFGYVTKVIHRGENFAVLLFSVDHAEPAVSTKSVTVTGNLYGLQEIVPGIAIQFVGDWVNHPKYGRQLLTYGWFPWATHDHGVGRFLSVCIPGFSDPVIVERLVEAYGNQTFDALTDSPSQVSSLFPPSDLRSQALQAAVLSWAETRSMNNLSIFLKDYDLSEEVVQNVFARFGTEAITLIAENPYRLVAVDGFDFAKADKLAAKVGIPQSDSRRFEGAIFWVLKMESQEGHLYVRRADFSDRLTGILLSSNANFGNKGLQDKLMESVSHLEKTDHVVVDPSAGVYLPEYFKYERGAASKLAKFLTPTKLNIDVNGFIEDYERGNQITFSEAQRDAIIKLIDNHVVAVTGLPGTGKTSVIRAVVRLFKRVGMSFLLMAPTGIAAKRLSAVTGEIASTIHRTFGWDGNKWEFNGSNKYSVGAVVLDEASMVDQEVFYRILDALLPSTLLVIVGDDAQLPSVGPGNVLRELLACKDIPHVRLTQIFRQAEQSEIVLAAHQINKGNPPKLEGRKKEDDFQFINTSDEDKIVNLIVHMSVKLKSRDANFQVIAPKYDGTVGVNNLNDAMREQLNPMMEGMKSHKAGKLSFWEKDRVMIVKNDYTLNVSNGDIGKIISIERDHFLLKIHGVGSGAIDSLVKIPKERVGAMLRLAYCVTCHRSQGNEFDTVILPIVKSHGRMLQRNLFYTAITRAKKKVWLIGETTAVFRAVANDKVVQRNTAFARAISEAVKENPV